MPIQYHKTTQTFHLYNKDLSYLFTVLKNGQLGQLYYGKRIKDKEDFAYLLELRPRPMAVCSFEGDLSFSMEHIKQEYSSYGHGDMRHPAYEIKSENGSRISEFVYQTHTIDKGKPKLKGLPATYCEAKEEATTLCVTLRDEILDMELQLSYTLFEDVAAIARTARFITHSIPVTLTNAMSMNLDLPDSDFSMIELTGAWAREREIKERKLTHGVQSIYSMRGCSSNNYNPFLALKRETTTEEQGEVYGFSFVYSGNFLASVEVDTYGVSRIRMGIHPDTFEWPLAQNDSFQTPEVIMVYSSQGMNAMSQSFHTLYQKRLARGVWRDKTRPILLNNWEATYFDFNESNILDIAKTAKQLGIELFVLDDGWFGKRNSDVAGLGDWYANLEKLPDGICGLSKKIEALGLQFGLWFEPEMVNHDSELYQAHPDWVFATPQRSSCHGRNQYVLDFSRKEVVDYIYEMMSKILQDASISYIKWDMNRCMSEVYSHGYDAAHQGCVMHAYILGVYDLYERLTTQFPNILFESCASGGARFDPGMLYYAPQCWTSDDTDAIERVKIQYGTSLVYPLSSMGSHVSATPNHQTLRNTPIETRANVAYFGTFGYELDINKLSIEEQGKVKVQIQFMKQYRELLQYGTFYRLQSPFTNNVSAWMVVAKDKKQAIVGYYRTLQEVNRGYERIPLQGLSTEMNYTIEGRKEEHYGDELMQYGLITSGAFSGENKEEYNGRNGDYQSNIYIITAK